jgi:prepilin-type N-terminal cleavage/methylation domain-containing protein
MRQTYRTKSDAGFTLTELLVAILVLLPVMAAAVRLFSVGVNQHATGQSGIDANQEARVAFEIMGTEIAQAGSHPDVATTISGQINASITAQSISVASTAGFNVGDDVDVDSPPNDEIVRLTRVSGGTLTGVFRFSHAPNAPIRLSAMPYTTGVISPAGLAPSSSLAVTRIQFFGHIQGNDSDPAQNDPTLQYVEYAYDSANNQITRSITPVNQTTRNSALSFIRNIRPGSVQFTLNTDDLGIVTSVDVAFTVRSTLKSGTQYQETPISARISIPSAIAASSLLRELQLFQGLYELPPTPPAITTWASLTGTQ